MEKFATPFGPLILIPDDWTIEKAHSVIPHEAGGHVRQARWCGFGIHPWAGLPIMGLLYGLMFFPIGLAYFRYRFERHADAQGWWALLKERQASPSDVMNRAQRFAATVASWTYLKPWPKEWVKRGFLRAAKRVIERYHFEEQK